MFLIYQCNSPEGILSSERYSFWLKIHFLFLANDDQRNDFWGARVSIPTSKKVPHFDSCLLLLLSGYVQDIFADFFRKAIFRPGVLLKAQKHRNQIRIESLRASSLLRLSGANRGSFFFNTVGGLFNYIPLRDGPVSRYLILIAAMKIASKPLKTVSSFVIRFPFSIQLW